MKRLWIVSALVLMIISLFFLQSTNSDAARTTKLPTIKKSIVTTTFWVGEDGSSDNQYISNVSSAWDEEWMIHFGGVDDPTSRNGFNPAAFTPRENPFYVALPYNDINEDGDRKSTAKKCPNAKKPAVRHYSWCKNSWVKITYKNRIVYAQWEDVGPYEEDDVKYVFGTARPINRIDTKAGLDVSPAVNNYLLLKDVDKTSWQFIDAAQVPNGPWKTKVTTSLGDRVD